MTYIPNDRLKRAHVLARVHNERWSLQQRVNELEQALNDLCTAVDTYFITDEQTATKPPEYLMVAMIRAMLIAHNTDIDTVLAEIEEERGDAK